MAFDKDAFLTSLDSMTVMELNELVKAIEEKFGVSAAAMAAPAGGGGGGAFAGKTLDVNGIKQLASIPSKEVLLAQICGLLMSPISRTAVVLSALAAKKGGGDAPAAEEAVAEAVPA